MTLFYDSEKYVTTEENKIIIMKNKFLFNIF